MASLLAVPPTTLAATDETCPPATSQQTNSSQSQPDSPALDPLLSEAQLLLRASAVTIPWDGINWVNEGQLGEDYNAIADLLDNGTQVGVTVNYEPDHVNGPGFEVPFTLSSNHNEYGFRIANNDNLDIPNDGAITMTFDITPIDHTNPNYKISWKYPGNQIASDTNGWVLEHIDDIGGGPGSGGIIGATFDGAGFFAQIAQPNLNGRQQITMRWDRDSDTVSLFRNGSIINSLVPNDISTLGDVTSNADVLLGKGNIFHNVVVHDRGLTNSEILNLHQQLSAM